MIDTTETPRRLVFRVVGVSFQDGYPANLTALNDLFGQTQMVGDEKPAALLQRDPDNLYDDNAIEVHVPAIGSMIGHISSKDAEWFAPMLDTLAIEGEHRVQAWVHEVLIDPDFPDRPGIDIICQLAEVD